MYTIKNINKIAQMLTEQDLAKLDAGAKMYLRHSRIEFKILEVADKSITIRTTQAKSPAENYLSQKDLISRTKDLFSDFFKDYDIIVRALAYEPSPVDIVNIEWVKNTMLQKGIALKQIVADTGIDKASLSAIINGHVSLSQGIKAMFYYYFKCK